MFAKGGKRKKQTKSGSTLFAYGGDKGSRLTAIAVRVRRDTDVSRRDRVQPDRRVKRVVGGALPLFCTVCRHIYTTCRIIEKRPELVESLADGGAYLHKVEYKFSKVSKYWFE